MLPTVFKDAEPAFRTFSYVEVVLYMVTWVLGYLYMLRVGAMNWDAGNIGEKIIDDSELAAEIAAMPEPEPVAAR